MTRGPGLLGLCLAAAACVSSTSSRAESYRVRQNVECRAEESCRALLVEIDRDLPRLSPDDAAAVRPIRREVHRQLEGFEEKRAREYERAEAAKDAAAADRQAQADQERALAQARQQRERAVAEWLAKETRACEADLPGERCTSVAGVTEADDLPRCRQGCDAAIEREVRLATDEQVSSCVARYLEAQGRGQSSMACAPDTARPHSQRVNAAVCLDACKRQGEAKVAERLVEKARAEQEALRSRPAPARRGGSQTSGGGGDEHLRCCDGTRSPTCTYGRASYRGCCSHHGGVC